MPFATLNEVKGLRIRNENGVVTAGTVRQISVVSYVATSDSSLRSPGAKGFGRRRQNGKRTAERSFCYII
jgi:hypothetical protein